MYMFREREKPWDRTVHFTMKSWGHYHLHAVVSTYHGHSWALFYTLVGSHFLHYINTY